MSFKDYMKNKATDPVPTTINKENGPDVKLAKQPAQVREPAKVTEPPAQELAGNHLSIPKPKPTTDLTLKPKAPEIKDLPKSPQRMEGGENTKKIHVIPDFGKTSQKFKIQEKKEAPNGLIDISNERQAYKARLEEIKGLLNLRVSNQEGYNRDKKRCIIRHPPRLSFETQRGVLHGE